MGLTARMAYHRAAAAGALALIGFALTAPALAADKGPFADFNGSWSGTGKIRLSGDTTERLRCNAKYRVPDSAGWSVNIDLTCASDSYKFNFKSDIRATPSGSISGRWTESTRNVGGTVLGQHAGSRIQVIAESSAFVADITINTRGSTQSATIKSRGSNDQVEAKLDLRKK